MSYEDKQVEERAYKLDFTQLSDYKEAVRRADRRIENIKEKIGAGTGLSDDVESCSNVFVSDMKNLWDSRREAFLMTYREVKKEYDHIVTEYNGLVQKLRSLISNDYSIARDSRNLAYEKLTGADYPEDDNEEALKNTEMIPPRYDDDGEELWLEVDGAVCEKRYGKPVASSKTIIINKEEQCVEEDAFDFDQIDMSTVDSDPYLVVIPIEDEDPVEEKRPTKVVLKEKVSMQAWWALVAGFVFAFVDFYFFRQTISQVMDVSTKDIVLSWIVPGLMTIIPLIIMFFFAGPYSTYVKPKRNVATIGSVALWLVYGLVFIIMRIVVPMADESMASSILLALLFFLVYVIDGGAMFIAGKDIWNTAAREYRAQSKRCKELLEECLQIKEQISSKRSEYARVRGNFSSLKMHSIETLVNFDKPDGFVDIERKHLKDKLIAENLYHGDSYVAPLDDPEFIIVRKAI